MPRSSNLRTTLVTVTSLRPVSIVLPPFVLLWWCNNITDIYIVWLTKKNFFLFLFEKFLQIVEKYNTSAPQLNGRYTVDKQQDLWRSWFFRDFARAKLPLILVKNCSVGMCQLWTQTFWMPCSFPFRSVVRESTSV